MASRKRDYGSPDGGSACSSTGKRVKSRAILSAKVDSISKHSKTSSISRASILCPHCECSLSTKTYKKHKMLYYDPMADMWTQSINSSASLIEETQLAKNGGDDGPEFPELSDGDYDVSYAVDDKNDEDENEVLTSRPDCPTTVSDNEDDIWEDNEGNVDMDYPSDSDDGSPSLPLTESTTDSSSANDEPVKPALLVWLLLFIARFQAKFYVPDIAIACLLKFLYIFLSIIGRNSPMVAKIVEHFPTSIYFFKKQMKSKESFVRYVVCRKCYSVYDYTKCIEKCGASFSSKKCTHRPHPNFHKCCDTQLLKTVHLKGDKKKLIPYKVYCYISLQTSLQMLLHRSDFFELCEQWRKRRCPGEEVMNDIYDGRIWKEFQSINGVPYLASPNVYALMINIDWFQPHKHTTASVGAIYLTILNLPCSVRYKRENTILLGILPGPSEPEKNINQFLQPLVKELQHFFTGIPMKVHGHTGEQNVRCLLVGVSCDMPAGRKTCGFLNHSALLGCCKCLKSFPGSVGNKDYSGFQRNGWKLRENAHHRSCVDLIKQARNKTEKEKLESKYGCRYSVLLQLPYFDPTRMLVIDPMHNLFLGTAKHMIKLWSNGGILSSTDFENIQKIVDDMKVPQDIGRIPRKIETKFAGFTADQYKNWTVYYSIPSLNRILDNAHLECWRHFVLACRRLCQKSISVSDVNIADGLLLQFCQRTQRIYGNAAVTPNMHMHCHLKDVLLDFGPVYSFWLFSYERYNGILEHQPSSNRSVEIEIMRRFISDNSAFAFQPPDEFHEELASVCSLKENITGSLLLQSQELPTSISSLQLPTTYTYHLFSDYETELLTKLLCILLKTSNSVSVRSVCRRYKIIHINSLRLPTTIAMAHWDHSIFGQFPTPLPVNIINPTDVTFRPIKIEHFATASYSIGGESHNHDFICAVVSWFRPHSSHVELGKPAQVWCPDLFESGGVYSFIPLDNLYFINIKQCIHAIMKIRSNENVLVVVPVL